MKVFVLVASIVGMLATTAVAQAECVQRCTNFYNGCVANGGTHEYCDALRGESINTTNPNQN
jgi:hypothetical protein